MRVLVAIANYGTKNAERLARLIAEYRSMPFQVHIVIIRETSREHPADVQELVGLPTNDPWSLPFAHRALFMERVEDYDLFIYSEDDTLIREENIKAFLGAVETLPDNLIAGFLRYELYPDGSKNYPEIHGPFHWIPSSVVRFGHYVYAKLSNDHSACYMLTQKQLKQAIRSGGYSLSPHSGRYDLLCTAATDPYTQCGFARVICLSHLARFEVHHLPNAYLNRIGIGEADHSSQVAALLDILNKKRTDCELFVTEKPIACQGWNKDYYEPCHLDLLALIPLEAHRILSIGCGAGDTEAFLLKEGKDVTVIPLDSVIGSIAERRGLRLLPPDFARAFQLLGDERFDVILLPDVLQHVDAAKDILGLSVKHLSRCGVLVGSVPNLGPGRRLFARLLRRNSKWRSIGGDFDETSVHLTSMPILKGWLRANGLRAIAARFEHDSTVRSLSRLYRYLPRALVSSKLTFVATRLPDSRVVRC